MGNNSLPPEGTAEKHVLRGEPGSFTAQAEAIILREGQRHTGSIIYMGRKGAKAGRGRIRAEVRATGTSKPRAIWEEGIQEGASCLVRIKERGEAQALWNQTRPGSLAAPGLVTRAWRPTGEKGEGPMLLSSSTGLSSCLHGQEWEKVAEA